MSSAQSSSVTCFLQARHPPLWATRDRVPALEVFADRDILVDERRLGSFLHVRFQT